MTLKISNHDHEMGELVGKLCNMVEDEDRNRLEHQNAMLFKIFKLSGSLLISMASLCLCLQSTKNIIYKIYKIDE